MGVVDWLNSGAEFGEWAAGRKPVTKKSDALRFGILGAAKIAYVHVQLSCQRQDVEMRFEAELHLKQTVSFDYPSAFTYRGYRRCCCS
jgi:hypothetical protein